jgi:hypothetical protein
MPAYHEHRWRIRREWTDAEGQRLRHRTCEGCALEQQLRFIVSARCLRRSTATEGFDTADLKDAKALLEELSQ